MFPKINVDELMQLVQAAKTDAKQVIRQFQQMEPAELNVIVSRALGEPLKVTTWQTKLIGGLDSAFFAGGVYRVSGSAATINDGQRDWTVCVKNLRSAEGIPLPDGTTLSRDFTEIQDAYLYWRREALVAESDLLADLPAGLSVPRYLGTTQISDSEACLWQELVPPDDHTWTWSNYREAAYRLGQWQGKSRLAQSLPEQSQAKLPWLSQNYLAGWTAGTVIYIIEMIAGMNGWQHPLLLAHFSPAELAQLQQLWEERHTLLAQLATLPKSLCHLDAYYANMVWRDNDLVLLDWANVGLAALGEELAAFVGATLWFNHVPLSEAETLETTVFDGYLAGLRTVGWDGDAGNVWQAYRCHMPLRYAHNALIKMLRTAIEPGFAEEWERKTEQPLAEFLRHEADYIRILLSRYSLALEAA